MHTRALSSLSVIQNETDPVDARRTSINYASVTFTSSPLALLKMATQ